MSNEVPLACDLTAIDSQQREEHYQEAEKVLTSATKIRELSNGYSFRLPSETEVIQQAGAFISRERLCCPFLDFTLEVKANHGPVWLSLTGHEGVKQFLQENVVACLETPRESTA